MMGSNSFIPSSLDMRNVVLKSSLPNNDYSFNFCHLNPGSLVANFDELKLIVKDIPLHIIAISETWFKSKHSNQHFLLDNYTLLRKDRVRRRGGGVAMYINKKLNSKIIYANAGDAFFDVMFVEISNQYDLKLVVGLIYNPPKMDITNELEAILNDLMVKYNEVIILGDFNVDFLVATPAVKRIQSMMSSFGFCVMSKEATNFVGNSSTLIDLVFTNCPANMKRFTQISVPGIATSHDMIYGSYAFSVTGNDKKQYRYIRNFRNIDIDQLLLAANSLHWSHLYCLCDVNEQLSYLNYFIIHLLDRFAPLKRVLVRRNVNGIRFSSEILRYRNIRDYLYENWKRHKTEFNRLQYTRARNKVNGMIKTSKRQFFKEQFGNRVSSKEFWKNYNTYINPPIGETKCEISPSEFNEYFGSVFVPNNEQYNPSTLQYCSEDIALYFHNVSVDDVCIQLASIKSNAVGADGITLSFVKLLLPVLLPFITYVLNSSLTKSVFPDAWKMALVIPLPKVRHPVNVNDFRPISILPILSKVFEKIIKSQINTFISKHNLLNKYQSGFRVNHSTTTALLKVVDDITSNLEDGKVGILVLLDFSKAFDKVDHSLLVSKLCYEFNFSKSACQLIFSYLYLRQQSVKYYGNISISTTVSSGVPQGSILGPLLFSMYINQVCLIIEQTKDIGYHLYADDLQLYSFGKPDDMNNVVNILNITLKNVFDWTFAHKLQINPAKSQAIIISNSTRVNVPTNHLVVDNHKIDFYDHVKSLGLFIDTKLNWTAHVNNLCSKIYGILSKLWSTAKLIEHNVKLHIIRTLVGPLILYCASIYLECPKKSFKKLNVAFNACARYIFSKRIGDPISLLSNTIFNMSLKKYLEFSTLSVMFSLILKKNPGYLYEKLNFSLSQRTINLNLPKSCRSKSRRRSFFVHGVKLWNGVDSSVKAASSLHNFKKLYVDTLFQNMI